MGLYQLKILNLFSPAPQECVYKVPRQQTIGKNSPCRRGGLNPTLQLPAPLTPSGLSEGHERRGCCPCFPRPLVFPTSNVSSAQIRWVGTGCSTAQGIARGIPRAAPFRRRPLLTGRQVGLCLRGESSDPAAGPVRVRLALLFPLQLVCRSDLILSSVQGSNPILQAPKGFQPTLHFLLGAKLSCSLCSEGS